MRIFSQRWFRRSATFVLGLVALTWCGAWVYSSSDSFGLLDPLPPVSGIDELAPGFRVEIVRQLDEEVTALAAGPKAYPEFASHLFIGSSPRGSVQRFDPSSQSQASDLIAVGLGDRLKTGICNVNALAIGDMDGDGIPELLASTSQIEPRGRPRLYQWTIGYPSILKGVVRPEIASSWSHGIGFLHDPETNALSAYVAFCGFGEIVEYQFHKRSTSSGFAQESLGWKQVGQLPASGEWLQVADVDNDDAPDLCVATGFAEGKAAIHVYSRDALDGSLVFERKIDESGRFGNVHFLAGDLVGDGTNDLVAWWCEATDGGDCEMVRYHLGPNGALDRTPMAVAPSDDLMPRDGQMLFHDLDGDGRNELWFAARSGSLWRFDPVRSGAPARILKLAGGIGPIIGLYHDSKRYSGLYLGSGKDVILLRQE